MDSDRDTHQELERLRLRVVELEAQLQRPGESSLPALGSSIDHAFEGIQVIDTEWRYAYLNATAARHGRRAREELIGRKVLEMYPQLDPSDALSAMKRCMEGRTPQHVVNRFGYPDGRIAWFELRISPVPAGIMVLSVDVTAQKAVEEELRRSREDLATTLRCIADGVITTDVAGRLVAMNPAAEDLIGWSEDEGRGRPLDELFQFVDPSTEAPLEHPVARVLRDGLIVGMANHTTLVRRGGEQVPIASSGAPIRDSQGSIRGVVLALKNMKEEFELTSMLQQAQKMEAIGRLAGGIAHDFNNLLSVINGYSEMMLGGLEASDALREPLQEIHEAGKRAASLTRQLLAFSRKQVLRPKVIDLNTVVERMGKLVRRLIGEDIDFVSHLRPDLHPVVADAGQIEQVVMNLVVNARDAMPAGGKLTLETANADLDPEYVRTHPSARTGPHAVIAITDTGIGMSEETKARIFEPFFTTKEQGKGTGLGLSTVYGIVKQSGGNVWVYSEPGRGTTFKIYLPRAEAVETPAPSPVVEAATRGGTILVVEDEAAVRGLVRRALEAAGYTVWEAKDGEEAERQCRHRSGALHLLLTDVVLPGAGGREVADRIRSLRPGVKVAFMSGYTDQAIVHHGILDPGTGFIEKPITPATLLRQVRELLA